MGRAWTVRAQPASRERMPMTTTTTASRRQAASEPRPPRELPVLFHLMDVSRPRGYSAPAATPAVTPPAEFTLGSRLSEPEPERAAKPSVAPPISANESVTSSLAAEFDLQMAASLAETGGIDATPVEAKASAAEEPTASGNEAVSGEDGTQTTLETPPPAANEDAVALRERAEERQRKRSAAARDDWFSTHGKYIVIGFVICLAGTVFLARRNAKPTKAPIADKHANHEHAEHDHAKPAVKSPTKTIRSASAEVPVEEPKSGTSPAAVAAKPAAETSQTALHPPTIPQLPAQPESGKSDDGLFPWKQPGEERVATRTDVPSPAGTATPAPASSPVPQPEAAPQYPTTSFGGNYQPVLPTAPPSVAPQAGGSIYGPALSAPTGVAPAASAYPPPAAAPQPSYPTTNSGLY
jgi:hypothetical protein